MELTNRERRRNLVQLALKEGWTHREIAEAAGFSRGLVAHITKDRKAPA